MAYAITGQRLSKVLEAFPLPRGESISYLSWSGRRVAVECQWKWYLESSFPCLVDYTVPHSTRAGSALASSLAETCFLLQTPGDIRQTFSKSSSCLCQDEHAVSADVPLANEACADQIEALMARSFTRRGVDRVYIL